MTAKTLVIIESPFTAPTPELRRRNERYLNACVLDVIRSGEVPYASHGFFPRVLNDDIPKERELGIGLGLAMVEALAQAEGVELEQRCYLDLDITAGMEKGVEFGLSLGVKQSERFLGEDWEGLLAGREPEPTPAPAPAAAPGDLTAESIKRVLENFHTDQKRVDVIRKILAEASS